MFLVKPKAIAFLENPKYDPSQDYSSEKILGNVKTKNRYSNPNNEKNNQNENENNLQQYILHHLVMNYHLHK